MKTISVMGAIGRDAESRQAGNDNVCSFSLAVDSGYGQNKRTLWFDVSIWGKRGEALRQYLTKGKSVAVSGEFDTREHNGKTYLTIRANEITLARGQSDGGSQQSQNYQQPADLDDNLPF